MTRVALAVLVLAVALPGALYLHERTLTVSYCDASFSCHSRHVHPAWEDPAALAVALVGVALALAIAARRGRG